MSIKTYVHKTLNNAMVFHILKRMYIKQNSNNDIFHCIKK